MKKATRSAILLRGLILLLAVSLLTGTTMLPLGAAAEDEEYVTWEYFPSTQFINGKDPVTGDIYRLSPVTMLSSRLLFMPNSYYHYANQVSVQGRKVSLTASGHGGAFVVMSDGTLMATNEGKQLLNKIPTYAGGFSEYRLVDESRSQYASFSEESLKTVAYTYGKTTERISRSLFELRHVEPYTVFGFMDDGWFGVPVAFIYELEDGLYYVDATRLTDDCFDSDGKLRPKSGITLNLYPLDEEQTDVAYDGIRRIGFKSPINTYESNSFHMDILGGEASPAETYVSVVFLGILLPIAPVAVGLCLPRSAGMGRKKRWYLLAILGGAWLLLGIVTLVMTIVCM